MPEWRGASDEQWRGGAPAILWRKPVPGLAYDIRLALGEVN